MKSSEICSLAINIVAWTYGRVAYRGDNTYYDPTNADTMAWYNGLTWWSGAWHADCLGLVRAVLCDWNANKAVLCGGANRSYGCFNFTEIMFLNSCTTVSNDFTQITGHPCSLVYKNGHVGLYVGEFQIGGYTYNVCECTTSYIDDQGRPGGGRPTWVDPDGLRRAYQGSSTTAGYWTSWGVFNLNGTDYGITEYDGGASPGATGFGSALSPDEVNMYWDTLHDLTYDQVEAVADSLHGMSADVFAVMAGWGWGEGYAVARPVGADEPDQYMGYLCDCIPVNYFEGLGITTGQAMADRIRGNGGSYYSYSSMVARAQNLKTNENTWNGQQELKALFLALLNPNQKAYYCNGYPYNSPTYGPAFVIYQNEYSGPGMIYVFYYNGEQQDYDITGSGIRGGWNPVPPKKRRKNWLMVKPRQLRNFYRLQILNY